MKVFISYLKSLKFRFFILLLIFGILPGAILRAGVLYAYEVRAISVRTSDITGQAKLFASQVANYDYLTDQSQSNILSQIEQMSAIYDGRVMLIDTDFDIVKDTYHLDEGKIIVSESVFKSFLGETVSNYDSENHYIEVTIPVIGTDEQNTVHGVMLISVSTDSIELNLENLRRTLSIFQVLIAFAVAIMGFLISFYLTHPFEQLARNIRDVKDGYEKDFHPVNKYSEVEHVSTACDDMLERLQLLDDSRQEFVSNVSHELKTPMASIKVLADSLNGQENVPIEMYQEFMADIASEIDRENKIISDLLSMSKLEGGKELAQISTVNVNDMLEHIMKRLKPIAKKQNIELTLESFRQVMAEVDEVKLSVAITNFIENAIKYNKKDGWVKVSLNADHQKFYVDISDSGIGIPADSLNRIYERFYRVDKSHSREIGGTGLGLAIAKRVIILHRGTVEVQSEPDVGTTFKISIPVHYIM